MSTGTEWHDAPLRTGEYDVTVRFRVTGPDFRTAVERVRKIVERDQFENHIVAMYVPRQPVPDGCHCEACVPYGASQ